MDIAQLYSLLPSNRYFQSLIILVLFFIVAKLVIFVSEKWLMRLAKRTRTELDDLLLEAVHKPLSFIILLFGIKLALIPLAVKENVMIIVNRIISSIVILVVTFLVIHILHDIFGSWLKKLAQRTKSKIDDQLIRLFTSASRIIFFLLGILFILDLWGVKVGPLLASLGIVGIAIAFALQTSLGNIFGGISLILDRSIKVGDIIKLESGEFGTVYDVGLRATRIRTFDNEIIIVPNGQLSSSKIQNFVLPDPSIRVNVQFGVQYGADPEFVKSIAVEEIKKIKDVMKEPAPWILFNEMGDNALLFKIMFWVDDLSKKWPTHQEAITRIYRRLYKEGIGIPFPQRTVWMYNAGKAPSPNPYQKKYKKFNTKYNVTLVKKEEQKNPEEEETEKIEKEAEEEAEKRRKKASRS